MTCADLRHRVGETREPGAEVIVLPLVIANSESVISSINAITFVNRLSHYSLTAHDPEQTAHNAVRRASVKRITCLRCFVFYSIAVVLGQESLNGQTSLEANLSVSTPLSFLLCFAFIDFFLDS
jgi:hypothetical protein